GLGRRHARAASMRVEIEERAGRPAQGRESPYQGLIPYSEADAEWFFGRDRWREIVIDNLRAYRVSVLYGVSGVGKSSLLAAGVVPALKAEARRNLQDLGRPEVLAVRFAAWVHEDPVEALESAIVTAVEEIAPDLAENPPRGS